MRNWSERMSNRHQYVLLANLIGSLFLLWMPIILFTTAITAHASGTPAQPAIPLYSCGNVGTGHCYGKAWWSRSMLGSDTRFTVVQMSCYCTDAFGVENGFIDNEQWLAGNNSANWVEGGQTTVSWGTGINIRSYNYYFWADLRPGYPYRETYITQVPSGDYGHQLEVSIQQDDTSTSVYHINFWSWTWSNAVTASGNTMTVTGYQIGMELGGGIGASSPTAHFTQNGYYTTGRFWLYEASSGSKQVNSPVSADWTSPPNGGTNSGGDWHTSCGC